MISVFKYFCRQQSRNTKMKLSLIIISLFLILLGKYGYNYDKNHTFVDLYNIIAISNKKELPKSGV